VREPKAARLALVEAFGAGPAAIERMEHASGLFEAMVVTSFERAPDRLVPPPMVVKGIVAGVARVARVRLLDGRSAELPALADELLAWVLSYRSPAVARLEGVELERRLARRGAVPRAGGVAGERHDRVEDGAGDARTRILQAAAKIAASRGALELTPRSISAAAGVSGETFAELFDHCGECFLAGLEHVCTQALERATRAGFAADEDWPDGVQRALATLVYQVATDPVLANVAFVEVFALGPAGVRCRESLMRGFAEALRAGAPPSQRPSELVAEATVGAVWGIMHHYVAHGAASRLPALTGQLSYVALAPMLGAEDAIERIMTEQTRGRASGRASRASVRADSTAPNHKTSRNIP
jgi:AcrR family transcriptional regulator